MRKIVLSFIMTLAACITLAQTTITGTVTDSSGEPLYGATVSCKNCKLPVLTDMDGKYKITVSGDAVLSYTYIGMVAHKEAINGRTTINVKLRESVNQLAEAVVVSTGYQKISRERSTASYGFVDSAKLNRIMNKDLLSALEGQVSGLRMNINPNTGENSPILRGVGTFSTDVGTQPLIVIDDMASNLTLDEVNPYDVESVTVLKDAAAASIYGALAANGVIVITTKQGKSQKARVNVNADLYISAKPNFNNMHYASASDIIDYETEVYNNRVANSGGYNTLFDTYGNNYYSPVYQLYRDQADGKISQSEVDATLSQWRQNDYYDEYRKYAWRTALTQRYNVSVAQKSGGGNHFASFNYQNDRERLVNSNSNSFSAYFKSTFNITKWMDLKVGIDARLSRSNTPNSSYGSYTIQDRYAQIKDSDGNLVYTPYVNIAGYVGSAINGTRLSEIEGTEGLKSYSFNVLESLDEGITKSRNVRMRPFVNLDIKFLKMFKYTIMYQYEWAQSRNETYDDADTYMMRLTHNAFIDNTGECLLDDGGRYYQSTNNTHRYTFRNQLNFDKAFDNNRHQVNAIMGLEFRENRTPRLIQQLMYGYNSTALTSSRMNWQSLYSDGWESLVYENTSRYGGLATSQSETFHRYASFYANFGYNYLHKYNLTGSIRWDEADLFGLEIKNQHHPLWSLGAGWNMSEENFMKDVKWLDYLKMRVTYGVNGNVDQSSSTYFVARYRTVTQDPTNTSYLSYSDDNLPNPQLRWEKTATFNLGFDFRILKNLLSGSIEYYNRTGSDLLVTKYLDSTLGASSRVINNGKIRNRGVELSLNANIIRKRDFSFTAGFNFAYNKNKMLYVEHSSSDIASNFITSPANYFIQGTSYNTLWAYRLSRVVNGYPVILDADGNEMVTFDSEGNPTSVTTSSTLKGTDALVNMGTITPVYNGSLSLNFRWKELELNALFIYSGGNKLRLDVADMNSYEITTTHMFDRWTESDGEGKVRLYADIPTTLQQYAGTFSEWWRYCDKQVRDADYIKLRSVNLSYYLPKKACRCCHLGDTKLTFQISNLFYLSKAGHDIDPESYSLNTGTRSLMQPRTFSIGLSTSF